ncbi:hypothetical protein ACIQAC_25525 [Streptomyces sp. NPDC088387]|uniref:hypothetical protein n=1 Tax=Streptomyces sp. NPDC088387 TaxID=3365859 RepID=UPI00380E30BC
MNVTNVPPDTEVRSVSLPRTPPRLPELRVQPAPHTVARLVSRGGGGVARDRMRLWSHYGRRYRTAMAHMANALAQDDPAPGGGRLDDRVAARADLAALHLYLAEEWAWVEPALLDGDMGGHLPLARCAGAALRRLPPYRGAAIVRTDVPDNVLTWFRGNQVVRDQGFWSASVSTAALGSGGPAFLVWSLTGRRTGAVDPYTPDRLVFLPGTRFKVLEVRGGRRPVVVLREMFPQESGAAGAADPHGGWLDRTTLAELGQSTDVPTTLVPTEFMGPRARPPGLVLGR